MVRLIVNFRLIVGLRRYTLICVVPPSPTPPPPPGFSSTANRNRDRPMRAPPNRSSARRTRAFIIGDGRIGRRLLFGRRRRAAAVKRNRFAGDGDDCDRSRRRRRKVHFRRTGTVAVSCTVSAARSISGDTRESRSERHLRRRTLSPPHVPGTSNLRVLRTRRASPKRKTQTAFPYVLSTYANVLYIPGYGYECVCARARAHVASPPGGTRARGRENDYIIFCFGSVCVCVPVSCNVFPYSRCTRVERAHDRRGVPYNGW